MHRLLPLALGLTALAYLAACGDDSGTQGPADITPDDQEEGDLPQEDTTPPEPPLEREPATGQPTVFGAALGCYHVEGFDGHRRVRFMTQSDEGERFVFEANAPAAAARFLLRPADLGVYLLFDESQHYLTAVLERDSEEADEGTEGDSADQDDAGWILARQAALHSAESLGIDGYRSEGEWGLEPSLRDASRFHLRHLASEGYLAFDGIASTPAEAAILALLPAEDCAPFPELSLDAVGEVIPRVWEDGDVFGIVDAHSHLVTNKGFGGGGMFHGAPYHRLGVEHALRDCDHTHGEEGRRDIIGFFYDGDIDFDASVLLPIVGAARTPEFNHHTEGYPTFTDWPNAWRSSTHQVQYYLWLERAYRAGLRLVVELATGNSVLCDFMAGIGAQTPLYSCNDMVGVDRAIEAVREMERYIDALAGGPGLGWFRIVESPAEARQVIRDGKLAVILGIETSNLFDCFLTPPAGFEPCTPQSVLATLDRYREQGVRVIFPVHKYDNAFAPGDGQRGIIELGNLVNSSHYSNFIEDCPFGSEAVFDRGDVTFGGLNRPRERYDIPAPLRMAGFASNPLRTVLPLLSALQEPGLRGNFCQNAGLTPLGETLIRGIMERGMIVDIAHLPQHAVSRALDILEAADYPATSTHGDTYRGRLYNLNGFMRFDFAGCANPEEPDTMGNPLRRRVQQLAERGLYAAPGFAFDLNGFAGSRRPRFGEASRCPQPQPNPVTYPFRSYAGDVEFTQPRLGDRVVDFNTEGMIHIGMLPEYIEDIRRDGISDEDLEPLFRSAEAYLRMWERAEARAAEGF